MTEGSTDRSLGLSKSRVMSALQCRKQLYFKVHTPDSETIGTRAQAAFESGNEIGEIARQIYATRESVFVDFSRNELAKALARTGELLGDGHRAPIFEATVLHEGVMVRVDVLVPVGRDAWRIVEVKASTKVKPEHHPDCALQTWVCRGAGLEISNVALAHVDSSFIYRGNGEYMGLLKEEDLTAEVDALQADVEGWVESARFAAAGGMPMVEVGPHCTKPYDCGFFGQCWPEDSQFPVHGLKGSKARLAELVRLGYRDIRDVPAEALTSQQHRRIHAVTLQGEAEILDDAREAIGQLGFPRHYLDFETIGPAVPIWPGTRPYQVIPVQWSIHVEHESGELDHFEFLDLSGDTPTRRLAEAMLSVLGDAGPVLMYTAYEKRIVQGLASEFPDLAADLEAVVGRLWDLKPVIKDNYYHPDMLGSWSIKDVIPTIAPDLRYEDLEEIQEGAAASRAYLEAIDPETSDGRREILRRRLLDYCRIDTEAMVRLVRFFS